MQRPTPKWRMMLKDLTLSARRTYERRRDFNLGTNCVSSMFLDRLGKFDAGPFEKVIVEAAPVSGDEIDVMDDVVRVRRAFDYDAYWRSATPKEGLAALLHSGLHELAGRFGWPRQPIDRALSEMKTLNFEYVVDWKRPVSSPSRRLTAQVRYYYSQSEVRLVVVVRTRAGEEQGEVELARTAPHELKFVPLLGRLRWDGDASVVLEPKRKGGNPIVRPLP